MVAEKDVKVSLVVGGGGEGQQEVMTAVEMEVESGS